MIRTRAYIPSGGKLPVLRAAMRTFDDDLLKPSTFPREWSSQSMPNAESSSIRGEAGDARKGKPRPLALTVALQTKKDIALAVTCEGKCNAAPTLPHTFELPSVVPPSTHSASSRTNCRSLIVTCSRSLTAMSSSLRKADDAYTIL